METDKYSAKSISGNSQSGIQSTALDPAVVKVLRSTYMLLGVTLAFSAIMAGVAMAINAPYFGLWTLLPYFICLWMTEKNKNNSMGIVWVFALTGWMGFTLGPILNMYLAVRGAEPIMMALGSTALVFFASSAYVMTTRNNLNFMTGFLMTGMLVAFVAAIANIFLQIPAMSLAISGAVIMLMSGFILYDTSRIVNGGERNYIMATISLYLSIFNLFIHLLNLIGALTGRD